MTEDDRIEIAGMARALIMKAKSQTGRITEEMLSNTADLDAILEKARECVDVTNLDDSAFIIYIFKMLIRDHAVDILHNESKSFSWFNKNFSVVIIGNNDREFFKNHKDKTSFTFEEVNTIFNRVLSGEFGHYLGEDYA
jgi:hypothetical protein